MKGVVLAGGTGSRLYPSTLAISKQLLPVYDKPMIYYPLSTLMLAGIRDVLIVGAPRDLPAFRHLFGDGEGLGMNIRYAAQDRPKGLAHAFLQSRRFAEGDDVCVILGDNLFYGSGFSRRLRKVAAALDGAAVFACHVSNPEDFGVVEFDAEGNVKSVEEKPARPRSRYAVTGLYFFENDAYAAAESIRPSPRGELEITEVLREYQRRGRLRAEPLGRGMAWLDTGTHASLLAAANFVEAVQTRQGLYVACLEEIAYRNGYISPEKLAEHGERLKHTEYGRYLLRLAESVTPKEKAAPGP